MTSPRVLLVTGASGGIGAATVRLGARRGFAVCVHYFENRELAEGVAGAIAAEGGRAGGASGISVQRSK